MRQVLAIERRFIHIYICCCIKTYLEIGHNAQKMINVGNLPHSRIKQDLSTTVAVLQKPLHLPVINTVQPEMPRTDGHSREKLAEAGNGWRGSVCEWLTAQLVQFRPGAGIYHSTAPTPALHTITQCIRMTKMMSLVVVWVEFRQ